MLQTRSIRECKSRSDRADQIKLLNQQRLQIIEDLRAIELRKRDQLQQTSDNVQISSVVEQSDISSIISKFKESSEDRKAVIRQHRSDLLKDLGQLNYLRQPSRLTIDHKVHSQKPIFWEIRQLMMESVLPLILLRIVGLEGGYCNDAIGLNIANLLEGMRTPSSSGFDQ